MEQQKQEQIRVHYQDYLGFVRTGYVAFLIQSPQLPEDEAYCLIVDENPEYNDKDYPLPDGKVLMYAEMRRSTECERIPEREGWSDET